VPYVKPSFQIKYEHGDDDDDDDYDGNDDDDDDDDDYDDELMMVTMMTMMVVVVVIMMMMVMMIMMVTGFVWVVENLESHGILHFQFPGLAKSSKLSICPGKSWKMKFTVQNKFSSCPFCK